MHNDDLVQRIHGLSSLNYFHADAHDDNFENYLSSKKNNPCVVIIIGEQNTWWRIHTINFDSFFQISLMEENYKKS